MSGPRMVFPVILPPGCARLVTSPDPIGSPIDIATMGMVLVARCAAWARGVPKATITSTGICASAEAAHSTDQARYWWVGTRRRDSDPRHNAVRVIAVGMGPNSVHRVG